MTRLAPRYLRKYVDKAGRINGAWYIHAQFPNGVAIAVRGWLFKGIHLGYVVGTRKFDQPIKTRLVFLRDNVPTEFVRAFQDK